MVSNKKAPWATGVVTKALYGPCHSTQSGLCVSTVSGSPGLLLAFPSWKKPGNDPTKNEPHDGQNNGCSSCGDRCIKNPAAVSGAWGSYSQFSGSIKYPHLLISAARKARAVRPNDASHTHHNEQRENDIQPFDAFDNIHASKCSTAKHDFCVTKCLSLLSASCYIGGATPVKRSRAWTPATSLRRKPQSLPQSFCGLFVRALFMVARAGSREARRFAQAVSGSPTCSSCRPDWTQCGGFRKPHCLESTMARSPAQVFAPTHPHIVPGLSLTDPLCAEVLNALPSMADSPSAQHLPAGRLSETALIQLHADAHNALNMAVFYLRQPQPDTAAARIKAVQALHALRNLSLSLEA